MATHCHSLPDNPVVQYGGYNGSLTRRTCSHFLVRKVQSRDFASRSIEREVAGIISEVQDMYYKQCTFSHFETNMNRKFISLPHVRAERQASLRTSLMLFIPGMNRVLFSTIQILSTDLAPHCKTPMPLTNVVGH